MKNVLSAGHIKKGHPAEVILPDVLLLQFSVVLTQYIVADITWDTRLFRRNQDKTDSGVADQCTDQGSERYVRIFSHHDRLSDCQSSFRGRIVRKIRSLSGSDADVTISGIDHRDGECKRSYKRCTFFYWMTLQMSA